MYATTATCPDVAFAVQGLQHLAQFNNNLGNAHWMAAQCTTRYLYATRNQTLVLGGLEITLTGWVDSDWGHARTRVDQSLGTRSVWAQDSSRGA